MRVDKITIAALQSLMRTYLFDGNPSSRIPLIHQSTISQDDLQARAAAIITALPDAVLRACHVEVVQDNGAIGGGSFVGRELQSVALVFRCDSDAAAVELERRLRHGSLPVIARIKASEVRINLRSVLPDDDIDLGVALASVVEDREQ